MDIDINSYDDLIRVTSIKDKLHFKCENCGKETVKSYGSYLSKKKLWCTTCLKKLVKRDTSKATEAAKSQKTKNKRKQTFLNRYGVTSNSAKIQELVKNKYGVDNVSQLDFVKEKVSVKAKIKRDIKIQKLEENNLQEFGTKSPTRIQRLQKTCLNKYGVSNPFQLRKVVDNTIQRNKDGHKVKLQSFINEYDLSVLYADDTIIKFKCNKCSNEFEIKRSEEWGYWMYERCSLCYPKSISYEQKEVYEFIKSIYNGIIIENDRKELCGKEIDIWIPEFRLGIEYNGLYWHSGDRIRHREKWELAQSKNIDLIQIWSSEWLEKSSIIKSIIKNRLGLSIPLYARKCNIKEVNSKEAREFADAFHMQGFYPGKYIGLYYDNELVDLSIFCKCRFGKKYSWELTRHIIKHGYRIIGGLSREIAYFRKLGNNGLIVDYCDMRLFTGNGHWGFKEIGITSPDMQYTDFKKIIPRGKYQKYKMSKIKGFKFNPSLTQLQNLHNNNMDFIYGVGHKIFVSDTI